LVSPVARDFDVDRVRTSVTGFDFDLVFLLGVQDPHDLGSTYNEIKEDLDRAQTINVDNTAMNRGHGYINFVDASYDDLSLMIYTLASKIGLSPNSKAAKALLNGMTYRAPSN
jgi:nanoRNase/pAp phosphatase (c-di-AMP/oligoRNAs hydrolase)